MSEHASTTNTRIKLKDMTIDQRRAYLRIAAAKHYKEHKRKCINAVERCRIARREWKALRAMQI